MLLHTVQPQKWFEFSYVMGFGCVKERLIVCAISFCVTLIGDLDTCCRNVAVDIKVSVVPSPTAPFLLTQFLLSLRITFPLPSDFKIVVLRQSS